MRYATLVLFCAALLVACLLEPPRVHASVEGSIMPLYRSALLTESEGRAAEALTIINDALRIDPAYVPLWRAKVRLLLALGKHAEALQAVRTGLAFSPEDDQLQQGLFRVLVVAPAKVAAAEGYDLGDYLSQVTQERLAVLLVALLAEGHGPLDTGLGRVLDASSPLSGDMKSIATGLRSFAAGDAAGTMRALMPLHPSGHAERLLAARLAELAAVDFVKARQWTHAEEMLRKAQDFGLESWRRQTALGRVKMEQGRNAEALNTFLDGWRDDPEITTRVALIADAALASGRHDIAVEYARRSYDFAPLSPAAQGSYVQALLRAGDVAGLEAFEERMEDAGNVDGVYYGHARELWSQRRYTEAVDLLAKVREPRALEESLRSMALQLAQQAGSPEEARRYAALVARLPLVSGMPVLLRDVGWDFWKQNQWLAAADIWNKAMQVGLEDPARRGQEPGTFVGMATMLLLEKGETPEARAFLARWRPAVDMTGFGWSMVQRGRYDLASKAFALGRTVSPEPYIALAEALAGLRNGLAEPVTPILRGLHARKSGQVGKATLVTLGTGGLAQNVTLVPSEARALYEAIAAEVLDQKLVDLYFWLMPPRWVSGVPASIIVAWQTEAGKQLLRMGRPDEADKYFQAALEHKAAAPTAALYRSLLLRKAGRTAEADALAQQAGVAVADGLQGASSRPADEAAGRGPVGLALGRANGPLVRGASGIVSPFDRHYVAGQVALLAGDTGTALDALEKALKLSPADVELRMQVITLLLGLGRQQDAVAASAWLEQRLASGDRTVRRAVAEAREALGDPEGAEPLWRELLDSAPHEQSYLAAYARNLTQQGRHAEVVAMLRHPVESGGNPALASILCSAEESLGRPADVLRHAEAGLAQSPMDLSLLRYAADAAQTLESHEAAAVFAERYLAINPGSQHMLALRGQELIAMERFDEAQRHYEDILSASPRNVDALRAMLTVGQTRNDPQMAYSYARRLHEAIPDDPSSRLRLGSAAAGASDFSTAYRELGSLRDSGKAVLVLQYPLMPGDDAPGVVGYRQFESHVQLLAARRAVFLGLDDIVAGADGRTHPRETLPENSPAVMLLVAGAPMATLERMDALLQQHAARAVFIIDPADLDRVGKDGVEKVLLQRLASTGRWSFALTDGAAPAVTLPDGSPGRFWGQRVLRADGSVETPVQMAERLNGRLATLSSLASDVPVLAWYPPAGLGPERLLHVTDEDLGIYRSAVGNSFALAFGATSEGFWLAGVPAQAVPVKIVIPGMDDEALALHLDRINPQHRAVLDLAKAHTWHGQYGRANDLYDEAAALPLAPGDVAYNRGANALFSGDVPTAKRLLDEAALASPESSGVERARKRAGQEMKPSIAGRHTQWWDSDDRSYSWSGVAGSMMPRDDLLLFGNAGSVAWGHDADGVGDTMLRGQDVTVGGRYFFRPGWWVEASGTLTATDDGRSPFAGYLATLHGPFATDMLRINGTFDLQFARERIDSLEAMRDGIRADRGNVMAEARVMDFWDVYANAGLIARTDGNTTTAFEGRILRRLMESPLVSFGYAFQTADSSADPDQYWAPQGVMTHLAYLSLSHRISDELRLGTNAGYGPSRSAGGDWEAVWRAGASVDYDFNEDLSLGLRYSHSETASYNRNEIWFELSYTF